jgi:hypothetical protein
MTKIFSLANYTSITVKGLDSEKFLQGQVSCDLSKQQEYFDGLFCDEKGYVITNAAIIKKNGFVILLKKGVAEVLIKELEKFSKFYDCKIDIESQDIYGKYEGNCFTKHIGNVESNFDDDDWESITMKNFCFDIGVDYSGKYRSTEIGYNLERYISYEKGCYRGQEIIARLTYLGKTTKKAVIFSGSLKSLFDETGRKIGKKIFETTTKDRQLTQFFVEKSEYYADEVKIIPVANQWDLSLD